MIRSDEPPSANSVVDRFLDAASDCEMAVELDQTYVKAWHRLAVAAQALDFWPKCITAYEKALDCLHRGNLSPADKRTREQCMQGLANAKKQRTKFETTGVTVPSQHMDSGQMPWDMAKKLTDAKKALGKPSCVFVLNGAEFHWKPAMEALSKQKIRNNRLFGDPHVMFDLVDAIMTDDRVFRMQGDFIQKMSRQTEGENDVYNGWLKTKKGPILIKQDILERLKTQPWGKVRPAIAFTIRTWIWTAFIKSQTSRKSSPDGFSGRVWSGIAALMRLILSRDRLSIVDPTLNI